MSTTTTKPHLGFIGLGKMGGPIAERLIRHGNPVTVYDVDARALDAAAKAGGRPVGSPRAVASEAQIVFTCLPALEIVREAALGTEGVCQGGTVEIMVDCSTTGPEFATQLGLELAKHDITLLDSPVSGGVKRAREGQLALIMSGNPEAYARVAPRGAWPPGSTRNGPPSPSSSRTCPRPGGRRWPRTSASPNNWAAKS